MTIQAENTIRAIVQNDPDFSTHLDFQVLRKEGLERLGELAGKIWTDHNHHDPGITIFENLLYALTDLGYRANLPFEDLIAAAKRAEVDDNFMTPAQALTVNPVTIMDYRKLLLEVPGIRNAWLKPLDQLDTPLYLSNGELTCEPIESPTTVDEAKLIPLNGLYCVRIEKEELANSAKVKQLAKAILSTHRNLCEDFEKIEILEAEKIGICAEVEILPEADAEKVYSALITAIAQFIQPQINYYTLPELLDKGKSIEDVFAGRPYSKNSHGFIDTEELEALPFRDEIYLSDLYKVVLSIEGVRRVSKLHFKGGTVINEDNEDWVEGICLNGRATIFSLEDSCVDLKRNSGFVAVNKDKIHKSLTNYEKTLKAAYLLDSAIPRGIHRKDLSKYYTIQDDFPVVYGIGQEGLPDPANKKREAQALQLKGYLLFFDQLLANYLAQLANVRTLFSAKAEHLRTAEEKITYATQSPSSVTGIEQLIRFYGDEETVASQGLIATPIANDDNWKAQKELLATNGRATLRIANHCSAGKTAIKSLVDHFSTNSAQSRDIRINRIRDAFVDGDYSVEILRDKLGCFFVFSFPQITDLVLIGDKRFPSLVKAREAAEEAAFIATLADNYAKDTLASKTLGKDTHFFDLIYRPISYARYIQELAEDESGYLSRRKEFLDHLLARFSEQFTDYALDQYEAEVSALERQRTAVHKQSLFLSNYADISRNRGKAFDFLQSSWNTANVSGFENRIAALSGIENYQRQNLCNFEVVPCFSSHLKDDIGNTIFRKSPTYDSHEEMLAEAKEVLQSLRDPEQYELLDKKLQGFNYKAARRMFSPKANPEENIEVAQWKYKLQLANFENKVIKESKKSDYPTADSAKKELNNFLKKINTELSTDADDKTKLRLLPLKSPNAYLNIDAFPLDIATTITWKWHVQRLADKDKYSSDEAFFTEAEAWNDLAKTAHWEDYLVREESASRWLVKLPGADFSLNGSRWYPNSKNVVAAWLQAKIAGKENGNYSIETIDKRYVLKLNNDKGVAIASAQPLPDLDSARQQIEVLTELFNSEKVKPDYENLRGKFSFQIPNAKGQIMMTSYQAYNSVTATVEAMKVIYELGGVAKQYFLSGDAANPNYLFLLQDKQGEFIAGNAEPFENEKHRAAALKQLTGFLKKQAMPITVAEEPRTYSWSSTLSDEKKIESNGSFLSKAKAKSDFDSTIVALVDGKEIKRPIEKIYSTAINEMPAKYRYVYGVSDADDRWQPLYQSEATFDSKDLATAAYGKLVKGMDQLKFAKKATENVPYELIDEKENKTVAIAYLPESPQPVRPDRAESVHGFVSSAFEGEAIVNPAFVEDNMTDGQNGRFLWRYLKKNAPIAFVPRVCADEASAQQLKKIVCNLHPFIDLDPCPKVAIVVTPDEAVKPKIYHWQLRIHWKLLNKDFVLISYRGYPTREEAKAAYAAEWFEILGLAKDAKNYGPQNSIRTLEEYAPLDSNACEASGIRAVIPKACLDLSPDVNQIIQFFVRMASFYPIYEDKQDGKKCYRYKVAHYQDDANWPCTSIANKNEPGNIVWQSVDCYESIDEAICAYQHFIPYALNPNACRIFCKNGKFTIGIFEIMAESDCVYNTADEAWDNGYPNPKRMGPCGECLPGGIREFVYAAEDEENFICEKEGERWKFKVVAPDYYVVAHNCTYDSVPLRDQAMAEWEKYLQTVEVEDFFPNLALVDENLSVIHFPWGQTFTLTDGKIISGNDYDWLCELIEVVRGFLKDPNFFKLSDFNQLSQVNAALVEWGRLSNAMEDSSGNNSKNNWENWMALVNRFPVYKRNGRYCFRVYYPPNDKVYPPLQRCGCEDEKPVIIVNPSIDDPTHVPEKFIEADGQAMNCEEIFPFVSKQCFDCCRGAVEAFVKFLQILKGRQYEMMATQEECHGPYSFCMVNPNRVLAYHPQQYRSAQEAVVAKKMTQQCLENVGLHLVEHILLRPKCDADNKPNDSTDPNGNDRNCFLPICPDEKCELEWELDDEDDPCAKEADPLCYIPGSDPYSFWATIALPAWKKPFRDALSRKKFEQLLYQEVPALVGLHILWLGPQDMCKFEDEYRKWLEVLQWQGTIKKLVIGPNGELSNGHCGDGQLTPQCAIVECIRNLRSEATCRENERTGGSCECTAPTVTPTDERCLPAESVDTLFWVDCPPEETGVDPDIPGTVLVAEGTPVITVAAPPEVSSDSPGGTLHTNADLASSLASLIFTTDTIPLAALDSNTDVRELGTAQPATKAPAQKKKQTKGASKKKKTTTAKSTAAAKTAKKTTAKKETPQSAEATTEQPKVKPKSKIKKTDSKKSTKPKAKKTTTKAKVKASPAAKPKKQKAKKAKVIKEKKADPAAKALVEAKRLVRLRRPGYLDNVFNVKDERLLATKSFERTVHFLKSPPSMTGYIQLLKFFVKHSLGREGGVPDEQYFTLVKNASWHVLDKLVLEKKAGLRSADAEALTEAFMAIEEKGMNLKHIQRGWKVNQIKILCHEKPLQQIRKMLK